MVANDQIWMEKALALARHAATLGEVPVGALVLRENQVISEAYNLREAHQDPTAHAEILAIQAASKALGAWRLSGCTLYVTLEPCAMCAGALVNSRVDRVVFGARDPKAGASESLYQLLTDPRLNHRCQVLGGVMERECGEVLSEFFKGLRAK